MKAGACSAAPGRAQARTAAAGLVNLSTNRTQSSDGLVELDRSACRVRRLARTVDHAAREIHFSCSASGGFRWRPLFVTLTYRPGVDWSRDHISDFVHRMRVWFSRRSVKLRMVWVAELQQRAAVHYHAVIWVPARLRLPTPDVRGWWPHGSSNVQVARSPIGYLCKYASKGVGEGQKFPRNCRTHGHSGLSQQSRKVVRYWCSPMWVRDAMRDLGAYGADLRRCVGGWVDRVSGLFVASPWRVYLPGNGRVLFYKVGVQTA